MLVSGKDGMRKSCLKRISDAMDVMTYNEKIVATYIMNHASELKNLTIQGLAAKLSVSTSAISNLVKKLGYNGYREFKFDVVSEAPSFERGILPIDAGDESVEHLFHRVASMNMQSFDYMLENFDAATFDEVVNVIAKAKRVVFFGMGGSGVWCYSAYYYLLRAGIHCWYEMDYHLQLFQTTTLTKDDVAIVYSNSGTNKDVLTIVDRIRESGATVVGISNFNKTPFAKSVDYLLYIVNDSQHFEDKKYILGAAHMCLIEALYHGVCKQLGQRAVTIGERAVEMFDNYSF